MTEAKRHKTPQEGLTYREAGVDVEAGEEAVRLIKKDVESTYIPGVLGSLGGFAGLFELPKGLEDPVLLESARDALDTAKGHYKNGEYREVFLLVSREMRS